MGVWGVASFQNDDAGDLLDAFLEDGDAAIAAAFEIVLDTAEDEALDASAARAAIAAAELVAAAKTGDLGELPHRRAREAFEESREEVDVDALRSDALAVLKRVRADASLKEIWVDAEDAAAWEKAIETLIARL